MKRLIGTCPHCGSSLLQRSRSWLRRNTGRGAWFCPACSFDSEVAKLSHFDEPAPEPGAGEVLRLQWRERGKGSPWGTVIGKTADGYVVLPDYRRSHKNESRGAKTLVHPRYVLAWKTEEKKKK
jgi:hypothetical protein